MCKYKTLKELKEALDNKELPNDVELKIDNDQVFIYDEKTDNFLFNFGGDITREFLPDALELLGFKSSGV